MDEKELAEQVIRKILGGDVFFLGNDSIMSFIEKANPRLKFERTGEKVKLRGYGGSYKLYFIKNDETFRNFSGDMVKVTGANFETLLGFFLEGERPINIHVYFIGTEFDLDKLSEMVYSLFTELGPSHVKNSRITLVCGAEHGTNKNR